MQPSMPGSAPEIPIEHWDVLFGAVEARLRLLVDDRLDGALAEAASRVRLGVLESVDALDLLHVALTHERTAHDLAQADSGAGDSRANRNAKADTDAGTRHGDAVANGARRLASHRSLCDRLNDALTRSAAPPQAVVVLHLDLDELQAIRESHGRQIGEDLLRIVAARLTRAVRTGDVVGHAASDGFICLLLGTPPGREQLSRLACRLFDVVTAPIALDACRVALRPSIGMSIWPPHGATAVALLESALAAVNHAKRHQLGYAFFDQRGAQPGPSLAAGCQGALA